MGSGKKIILAAVLQCGHLIAYVLCYKHHIVHTYIVDYVGKKKRKINPEFSAYNTLHFHVQHVLKCKLLHMT